MIKTRKTAALFIVLLTVLSLFCACGKDKEQSGEWDSKVSDTYLTTMDEVFSIGMEYAQNDATVLANYHISSALAGCSSLRLCIDRILYNRGEGDSFADVVGSASYSDRNELRRVNRASPYPAFFAGLIYELQEKRDNAEACYREAQLCPGFTHYDMAMTIGGHEWYVTVGDKKMYLQLRPFYESDEY